jgi:predicted  nucleic acid-binding Zn-ribbon protein
MCPKTANHLFKHLHKDGSSLLDSQMSGQKPLHMVLQTMEAPTQEVTDMPTTLEAFHSEKMRTMNERLLKISILEKEIEKKEAQIEAFKGALHSDEYRLLLEELQDLEQQVVHLNKDDERLDYFLQVGDILFNYYESQEKIASGNHTKSKKAPSKLKTPQNSVLNYFSSNDGSADTPSIELVEKVEVKKVKKARDIEDSNGLQRDKALEKYLSIIEPTAIRGGILPGSGIEPDFGACPHCPSAEMVFYHNEATLGCPECGYQDFILVDSEKPSYKDPPREISYFAYKKINHFNEWLAQFQAKESTEIPPDVYENILAEIKKERILDPRTLKPQKLREVLKKLHLNKFYEHIPHILHRMNAFCAPTMSREMEDKLRYMFKEIQPSFIRHCPRGRSNFLSYSYVLYKFCQLLELDDFLPCFPLLKSHEKLYMQDNIWQKICVDLGWEFIRTI